MNKALTALLAIMFAVLLVATLEKQANQAEYQRCRSFFQAFGGFDSAPEVCQHIVYGSDYSLQYPNE
jgi:hypothetical protein